MQTSKGGISKQTRFGLRIKGTMCHLKSKKKSDLHDKVIFT